ncbi:hypothetical protein MTR67_008189 [Solanum verrucosum]|uniref:Serine aminopeptidase S33 domain-containing protein n=1 Tax=Solanum verrucosum TaxID=315347 RepID=A0AAF0Q100_SOLVR|nr:hypothetical protein MTR67_008189 [Solanum verrucosum]
MPHAGLKMKESYEVNSRGLDIFSKSWLPETIPPKAMVYFCHGYGDTCTFFVEGIARKLASSGYGVFAMDYPGFGLSEGLHGYIPSFDKLVDDVIEHYSKAKGALNIGHADNVGTWSLLVKSHYDVTSPKAIR